VPHLSGQYYTTMYGLGKQANRFSIELAPELGTSKKYKIG